MHHDKLVEEITRYKGENVVLMKDIEALNSDSDHVEIIARDKLGLIRKGEIVYYYNGFEQR